MKIAVCNNISGRFCFFGQRLSCKYLTNDVDNVTEICKSVALICYNVYLVCNNVAYFDYRYLYDILYCRDVVRGLSY